MRDNPVRSKLKLGEPVIGTMITDFPAPSIALLLAQAGFDFFFIDMEHGTFNLESAANIIRVARLANIMPFVRVPDAEYHLIARVLDIGAMGVMVPRVETRETVERCVAAMRYPPLGKRGCAIGRGNSDYMTYPAWEYTRHANENILSIMQIESQAAVERIDELLSVQGVDAALIGPNDLTLSLGAPDMQHASVNAAIQTVVDSANRHHVASGIHFRSIPQVKTWKDRGMTLLTCSTEMDFIRSGARSVVEALSNQRVA